ncbi:MAG: hypothetical protein ACREJ3_05330, partial [Polyangiaceae bacterium]
SSTSILFASVSIAIFMVRAFNGRLERGPAVDAVIGEILRDEDERRTFRGNASSPMITRYSPRAA